MVSIPRDAPYWAQVMADDITRELRARSQGLPVKMAKFVKTDMPDPARWNGAWIVVTNDVGGEVPAFSDGTNWRRATDRAIIS
jgi:hypothetical protein